MTDGQKRLLICGMVATLNSGLSVTSDDMRKAAEIVGGDTDTEVLHRVAEKAAEYGYHLTPRSVV